MTPSMQPRRPRQPLGDSLCRAWGKASGAPRGRCLPITNSTWIKWERLGLTLHPCSKAAHSDTHPQSSHELTFFSQARIRMFTLIPTSTVTPSTYIRHLHHYPGGRERVLRVFFTHVNTILNLLYLEDNCDMQSQFWTLLVLFTRSAPWP